MAADPLDIIARICHEQPHDALAQIADALGYTEQAAQERAQREQTLAGLLKRCARCLPPDHATRKMATDYLRQHGYLSPLRALGVTAPPAPCVLGYAVMCQQCEAEGKCNAADGGARLDGGVTLPLEGQKK